MKNETGCEKHSYLELGKHFLSLWFSLTNKKGFLHSRRGLEGQELDISGQKGFCKEPKNSYKKGIMERIDKGSKNCKQTDPKST